MPVYQHNTHQTVLFPSTSIIIHYKTSTPSITTAHLTSQLKNVLDPAGTLVLQSPCINGPANLSPPISIPHTQRVIQSSIAHSIATSRRLALQLKSSFDGVSVRISDVLQALQHLQMTIKEVLMMARDLEMGICFPTDQRFSNIQLAPNNQIASNYLTRQLLATKLPRQTKCQ